MIETAGIILAAAIVGALLNRIRGGGLKPQVPRFGLGRSLWLVTPIVGLIAWPFIGALPAFYLAALYLLGSVSGWGSYFDLSRKRDGWSDDPEVEWIDRVLMEVFGPQWAMDKARIHPIHAARGDVIYNEGRERPASWRWWRDFTGMALRGLHYLPMMLVIPTAFASWWALAPGIIGVALFAPVYWMGWNAPGWLRRRGYKGTGLAEYIVGAFFGAALAVQYLVAT